MKSLILKSLLHRKLQSLAIAISIAFGIAIIFAIAAIYQGVHSGMELSKQRMGADIVVIPGGVTMEPSLYLFGGATVNTYMPKETFDILRKLPGVTKATPQFFTHTLTADCHDIGTNNRMLGYDPDSDWILQPWLKKINKNCLADDEVILGAKVPTWTQDKISILGKWYNIVTIAEETGTTLDYSLFVSMEEARRVAGSSSQLQSVWANEGNPTGLISSVLLQIDPAVKASSIVDKIQQIGYFQTIVAAEVKQRIIDQFTILVYLLGSVGALTAILSLFHLFTRFYALTWERQAEWGLYLAIGASALDLAALIVGEAVTVSLIGSVCGIALGSLLYVGGLHILQYYQSFPFIQPSWQFLTATALLLVVSFSGLGALAAWLPAYRGSQIDPSTIMTRGEFD
ncbi:ABC transporter permease [Propionispora vibrioides]|uniref:Putative hemin transport system permease protein HrtB n=1 Tax=Propionispora vibrioides TaxID=112903 RepID=A0A1H8T426_9FIRM|nr:FtsX-like permease family protein [Propionispora vibrioides]SEO85760.1 putative ABC transport system permease protein [Propionispora vibrioides]